MPPKRGIQQCSGLDFECFDKNTTIKKDPPQNPGLFYTKSQQHRQLFRICYVVAEQQIWSQFNQHRVCRYRSKVVVPKAS